MPRPVRIAICQFASEPPAAGSVSANFAKLDRFISSAAQQHADLIVFPEYFLTGIIADHLHLASDEGHWVEDLQMLAKTHRIDIVAGTIVEKSHENEEHLFNTARYIDKHGEVLGQYRKKHLWHPSVLNYNASHSDDFTLFSREKEYLQGALEEHQIFEAEKFKAGLLICWDIAWPEAFRALLLQGVEVVLVPTHWVLKDVGDIGQQHDPQGKGETAWLDSLMVTRAYENECCVVFVNCGGPHSLGFLGRSGVALPFKGPVTRIESSEEEMRVVEIDLDILKDAKNVYRIRDDLENKQKQGLL